MSSSDEKTDRVMMAAIAGKLSRVSEELAYLRRDGKHGMGYSFITAQELFRRVFESLRKNGLAVVGTQQDPKEPGKFATVKVRIVVADLDTGWTVGFEGTASGTDAGDKGTSKAVTMAAKSAWMIGLGISTGDDEETVVSSRESARNFLNDVLPTMKTMDEAASAYVTHEGEFLLLPDEEMKKFKVAFRRACKTMFGTDNDGVAAAIAQAKEESE